MKYAIDSNGNATPVEENRSVMRFLDVEIRLKELKTIEAYLIKLFEQKGLLALPQAFFYKVQPFNTKEELLFFTRTEFSSSSDAVKLSNEIEKHPEILHSGEKIDFLRSIFSDDSSGRVRWYYLNVHSIVFERNLYDCKKIDIQVTPPVQYATFMKNMTNLITKEELNEKKLCNNYLLKENGVSVKNPKEIIKIAIDREIIDGFNSLLDTYVSAFVDFYCSKQGINEKDKTSNIALTCLSAINENKNNFFEAYSEIKNCIKKNLKGSHSIRYYGNEIVGFLNDGTPIIIYVIGTKENPKFVVNGNTFDNLEEFKEALITRKIFEEKEWFKNIKPYITKKN